MGVRIGLTSRNDEAQTDPGQPAKALASRGISDRRGRRQVETTHQ
jgi:hypothetical protein